MQTEPDWNTILELPCSVLDFEAGIWSAILEQQRDWGEVELEYLRRSQGLREQIWDYLNCVQDARTTQTNYDFLEAFIYQQPGIRPRDIIRLFDIEGSLTSQQEVEIDTWIESFKSTSGGFMTQDLKTTHYRTLRSCDVPAQLALRCAEILAKDNALPNLGRTPQDQELINQSHQHILRHYGHESNSN